MSARTITELIAVPAAAGFFFDDQVAIRAGARHDGFAIVGEPVTPGYRSIRQPAEAVSVLLRLDDGYVAHGDCVSVQYSGVGGRDPLLSSAELVPHFEAEVAPRVRGRRVTSFRELSAIVDDLSARLPGFGTAAAYGLSQALLDAAAHAAGRSMARTIQAEWGFTQPMRRVPIYVQSGEQRHQNVDKMILRGADSLPHGLINRPELIGEQGREIVEYVSWVSDRIRQLRRDERYAPVLHFDVYGLIGLVMHQRTEAIAEVLVAMEQAARPFALRVEHPLDAGSRAGQIKQMVALRQRLGELGSGVQLVADEWANTIEDIHAFNRAGAADMMQIKTPDLGGLHHTVEAVDDCRQHGVLAHIGGSCCETERSATVCVHVALATGADQILAKPGMGVDEGMSIVGNEMARILALETAAVRPAAWKGARTLNAGITPDHDRNVRALAELAVRFGANVQPGQIVAVSSEPGKEEIARAIAEAAYAAGAKFVDLSVFDVHLKRARARHADPESLDYVPPWMGERLLALSEARAAAIAISGPAAPHAMDGIDPALVARDMLPRLREWAGVVNARTTNSTIVPGPTREWAMLVHPRLEPDAALARLWDEIAHICRLDEADPIAAWDERFGQLLHVASELDARRLDRVLLQGPGTHLSVGLLPSSHWVGPDERTIDGIVHHPNLPSEEVFTTPDPERVEGTVTATRPLVTSGATIDGLRVRFVGGRAVQIDADDNAEVLRGLAARDENASRLGELALVDREGRIGPLGTVFYDTLLDENAVSHIALGAGYQVGVSGEPDRDRINVSQIHIDFMIGSDELDVTGVTAGGEEVPLLRGGSWQI